MINSVKSVIRKIKLSISKRGTMGTLGLLASSIIRSIINLSPSQRRVLKLQRKINLEFDNKYGVNTDGNVSQTDLAVNSENHIFATKYEPISIYSVNLPKLLEAFSLPYEEYIFIDYGSGKGRPILLAAAYPFKKIIGVEFSDELNSIAKDNISRYSGKRTCVDIELICMDAVDYVCPADEPLVLYFFNPFGKPVMEKVVGHISSSYQNNPRRMIILYFNPLEADVWDKVSFLSKKKATRDICIYDTNP